MTIDSRRADTKKALSNLWSEAFGDTDEFISSFFSLGFDSERCMYTELDGAPRAALYWFDCTYNGGKIAYLYAIATAKAYRGRGLCQALMQRTHGSLRSQGYDGAILVPADKNLFGFYEKSGYKICSSINEFSCLASDEPVKLVKIDTLQYAKMRRSLLPSGSVIQEGAALAFLSSQADFYMGEDFVIACREENGSLFGIELLGNTESAPSILNTLGFEKGHFRCAGGDKPFAMYIPLTDRGIKAPDYFGLALD